MAWIDEEVSAQFAHWELRGRGWQVWPEPVEPEPPFVPFTGYAPHTSQFADDGRRPHPLISALTKLGFLMKSPPPEEPEEPAPEPEPRILQRSDLVELQTSLPASLNIPKEVFEQFLSNLSLCHEPIAFELLGVSKKVTAQFAVHEDDASLMRRQLEAYFPEAVFQKQEGALEKAWYSSTGEQILVVEFGLEREFMFPLASGKLDPFIGIIGALSELRDAELGLFQVIFEPVRNPWAESITRSVTHADGKPYFANMPELADAAKNKVSRLLYAAVVRILVRTERYERTLKLARDLAGSLRVFIHPHGNALMPLANDEYPSHEHIEDAISRQSRRTGMLLNIDELMGFVHLPSRDVRSTVLQRETAKTKAAPSIVRQSDGLLLGNNVHAGESISVRLTPEQRVYHTYIIGATGTGKTTLLFNLIRQDIENGDGLAVLDPHGDLVDRILDIIPRERIDDVVLVDPSDQEYSIGFNILSAHSDTEKNLLASDLVSVFERLSTSWGDQMGSVLQNAILAFLESSRRGTLADMQRFLIEPSFRSEFLKSVKDKNVVYYWQKVFPQLSGNKSVGPVLTRLTSFLSQKPIRYMVSQPENRLDFAQIMDSGKIFLAKLSEGLLGQKNAYLLGTLLIGKFQQLAMSRQAQQIVARRNFWVYIDEFANFITPSMAEILSGARKYRIGLTLAHQDLHQLQEDSVVASAVRTHPLTRIVFRVGDEDAKKLGEGFSFFDARDLKNLEKFQAIARVERSDFDFNLSVLRNFDPAQAPERRNEVIRASRAKYGTPRSQIDALLEPTVTTEPIVESEVRPVPQSPVRKVAPSPTAAEPETPAVSTSAERKAPEVPKSAEEPLTKVSSVLEPEHPPVTPDADSKNQKHGEIKERIRAEAEILDYTVNMEVDFPAVNGRADLVLERGKQKIIAQVNATSPVPFEVESIQKFLQTNVTHIALVSVNRKKLNLIQSTLEGSGANTNKVAFYSPSEFIAQLFDWAAADPAGGIQERGKPRKRSIDFSAGKLSESERRANEATMLEALRKTLER